MKVIKWKWLRVIATILVHLYYTKCGTMHDTARLIEQYVGCGREHQSLLICIEPMVAH
jgi:hypothetical protein